MRRHPDSRNYRMRMYSIFTAAICSVVLIAGCSSTGEPTPTVPVDAAAAVTPTQPHTPSPLATSTAPPSPTYIGPTPYTVEVPLVAATASGYRVSVISIEGARFPRSMVTITMAIKRVDTELQGLTWAGEYMGSMQPTGDRDNPTILLHFHYNLHGHPDDPVAITLLTLRFTDRSGERPQTITVEDRWHLHFVPSEFEV